MTRDEALHLLNLQGKISPQEVQAAVTERRAQLEQRIASAPTEALRTKYRRQLEELEEAESALLGGAEIPSGSGLSETMMGDLPLAEAWYTQVKSGGSVGGAGTLLKPGHTLGDRRYHIQEQIGVGGMGAVYRAFDKNRDKDIAIKVLLPAMLARPKAKERFLHEARLSSEMSHPNIVTVFDVQQDGPHTFLTMELLRGQSLRSYLAALKSSRKTMTVDEALKIADQVCLGLAYAHEKGVIHRDIKPENIWLAADGKAKVMDFGIARLATTSQMTQTMMTLGTAYYMAPEQLQGLSDIDGRADQYSAAVMLYELLTGQIPTGRIESLDRIRKEVPGAVSRAVDKALSPRREERFRDMEEFRNGLRGKGKGVSVAFLAKTGGLVAAVGLVAGMALAFPHWRNWFSAGNMQGSEHQAPPRADSEVDTSKKQAAQLPQRQNTAHMESPSKDAQQRIQENNLRLLTEHMDSEIKSLQKMVEERRRDVDAAAKAAKREVESLESQLNAAKDDVSKHTLQAQLWSARTIQAGAESVQRGFRSTLEGADGLASQDNQMKAAIAALNAGQLEQAKTLLDRAKAGYAKLKETPGQLQSALNTQRANWLKPLNGKWASDDCKSASTWQVKDPDLNVSWPKAGLFSEKIIGVGADGVVTIVASPAKYKGRMYFYKPDASNLVVNEIKSGRQETLRRCQ